MPLAAPVPPIVEMNSGSYASIWGADGTVDTAVVKDYRGDDNDKPSANVVAGSTYFAWDTSKFYMYDGTQWNELFGSGE